VLHRAEISLANGLLRLLHGGADRLPAFAGDPPVDWDRALSWHADRTGTALSPAQRAAVRQALTARLSVLGGGTGCGAGGTVDAVVALAAAKKARVLRLDVTDLPGLLGLRPGGAAHDRERPLDADLVIASGMSMVDLRVADRLVRAVPDGAHLLLVGDPARRPAPGPGQVLRDLLAAEAVPRTELTEPLPRADNGIAVNAARIRQGLVPRTRASADFFLFPAADAAAVAELVVDVVARRLPARFGLDAVREIQVLTAGRDGPAGADALDAALRAELGPARDGTGRSADGRPAGGYAEAVDAGSGEGWPAVVVPVVPGGGLDREGLYTAVARAGRLVVLVGSREALAEAVRTEGGGARHTTLTYRLTGV
jgi:exodeoxyribonuclease V alpha subunit